jgi:hypothetical protein
MNRPELAHLPEKVTELPSSGMASNFEHFDDLLWTERICEQCGQDHRYRPTFERVKTSIDIIPELITFMKKSTTAGRK